MEREIRDEYDGMLFFALREDACARLARLLAAGANPGAINEDGVCALRVAIDLRRKQAVSALIEAGADPLARREGMGSPWDAAKAAGPEMAGLLRRRVDELTAEKALCEPWIGTMPDRKDARGYSLLHLAALDGMETTLGRLLGAGAAPDDRTLVEGDTALHIAARAGHARCCAILVDAGADHLLENDEAVSPLAIARRSRDESLMSAMLRRTFEK